MIQDATQNETRAPMIVFCGGEGSGKSSQSRTLVTALTAQGVKVLHTREPGGSPGAEQIRNLLVTGAVDRWSRETEMLLFAAARRDHIEKTILPALNAGRTVVCDRFLDSTLAYQAGSDATRQKIALDLHRTFCFDLTPDLTFLLDVDPEVGLTRSGRRIAVEGSAEGRFEAMDLEFHRSLREAYRARARLDPARYVVIDAARRPQEIAERIYGEVRQRFGKRIGIVDYA